MVCLKREKICVGVLLNPREKIRPGWGRRLVAAWMVAGFGTRIVIWGVR